MWGDRVEVAGASGEDALNGPCWGPLAKQKACLCPAWTRCPLRLPPVRATASAPHPPARARGSQRARLSAQHFLITIHVPDLVMSCDVLSVALQRRPIGEPPSLGVSEQAGSLGSPPSLPVNKGAVRGPSGPAQEGNEGSKAKA